MLAFMVMLMVSGSGSASLPLACPSLQPLREVPRPDLMPFFSLMSKLPMPDFSGTPSPKKPLTETKFEGHQDSRKSPGHASGSSPILNRMGVVGMAFLMCCILQLHSHDLQQLCRLVHFPNFWISGGALLPIGLCSIWLKVTIFSLGNIVHYSIILNCLTIES